MKFSAKGFTIIEVMVVTAIIGLLAAVCIPYIIQAYSNAVTKTRTRNISDINKTKAQLTLPVGTVGGEGYSDSTVVNDTVKGKINALLRIESASDLAVGGIIPDYGATIGDAATYTTGALK